LAGELEGERSATGAGAGCSNRSLNDKFVDIGNLHQGIAQRIQSSPTQGTRRKPFHMHILDQQAATPEFNQTQ
jgi:hypothetical protein